MLEAIRKRSSSIIVKALFVVLILSFGSGIWMNWDLVRSGFRSDWAAKVGDKDISKHELSEEYQRAFRQLRAVLGETVTTEQAQALNLPNRVLAQMVNQALLDLEGTDLGLIVSDDVVRQEIYTNPQFHNRQGQFDSDIFRQTLRTNGLTEDRYTAMLRGEIAREQLINSLFGAFVVPKTIVNALHRYRNEKRTAEYFRVADDQMTVHSNPDDATLQTFYQDHKALFTAPEHRAITAIIVRAQDLARQIQVTEEDLTTVYGERISEFSEAERRSVEQMLFASEDAAKGARARLAAGEDFRTVAQEAGLDPRALELGTVTREELLAELAGPAFAIPPGSVSEPIQSPFGWHVLKINKIVPARHRSFAEVREELAQRIAGERAVEMLYDISNRLDDAIGRGATLEEAASELNLQLVHLEAINRQGVSLGNAKLPDLPARFVDVAFSTEENLESPVTEADANSYFVLRVDKVTPPTLKPFDSIREQVYQAWKAAEQERLAQSTAVLLAERIRGGLSMAQIAAESRFELATTPPMTRAGDGTPKETIEALIAELFRASGGDPFVVRGQNAFYVARLASVIPANSDTDDAGVMKVRRELTNAVQADLLSQVSAAFGRRWPVKVNEQVVKQLTL